MNNAIRICEVGPRDGLQNEPTALAVSDKVAFVESLALAGLREIEVGAFVRADRVPQMADTAEVFATIKREEGVRYTALVPNERGLHAALEARADGVSVFTATTDGFTRANVNATVAETHKRFAPIVSQAHAAGIRVRAYVSCIVACPYDGPVDPAQVRGVVEDLLTLGVDEIDLGETLGVATPADIEHLLAGLSMVLEPSAITLHLHDTRATALACALWAIQLGVRSFDTSAGGLGGCPFAPGSAGNLATEELVYMCDGMGLDTGVSVSQTVRAAQSVAAALGGATRSRLSQLQGDCNGNGPSNAAS